MLWQELGTWGYSGNSRAEETGEGPALDGVARDGLSSGVVSAGGQGAGESSSIGPVFRAVLGRVVEGTVV